MNAAGRRLQRLVQSRLLLFAHSVTILGHRESLEGHMAAKRTTHRSSKGTKLYAVRDKEGKFEDIQTYKKAHGQDIKRKSKAETAKKAKKK
jgi:hypothetical protein